MTINGQPVAEIDIKASHLAIYSVLMGVSLPEGIDPHSVPGIPRLIVKRIVTAFFNNGHLRLGR